MIKKSFRLFDHPTSLALEAEFWESLSEIAALKNMAVTQLISRIDRTRTDKNLASALRVYILLHYKNNKSHIHV
jgi:predicted DNA-binding ribbon-helix-helix protein